MVKSLQDTVARWSRKVSQAEGDYYAGVQRPSKDWQAEALRAEPTWNAAIQAAINRRAWGRGVSKTPTADWQQATLAKAPRWLEGVSYAMPKYQGAMDTVLANVQSSVNAIAGLPKGPKGSEENLGRALTYMRTMHQLTEAGGAYRGGEGYAQQRTPVFAPQAPMQPMTPTRPAAQRPIPRYTPRY